MKPKRKRPAGDLKQRAAVGGVASAKRQRDCRPTDPTATEPGGEARRARSVSTSSGNSNSPAGLGLVAGWRAASRSAAFPWMIHGMRTVYGVVLLSIFALPASAQFAVPQQDPGINRVLMLAPREYQQQLRQAEEAIAREEYSVAIQSLAAILASGTEPEGQRERPEGFVGRDMEVSEDFFIGHPTATEFQSSLRGEARRLLGSLPPRGKELYRLQYNAEAARLLKQALEQRDPGRLEEVVWQYFHTDSGYLACMLLGRHQLDVGRPVAASLCFSRLAQVPEARDKFDPQLSLLLALGWTQAGQADRATEVLTELRRRDPEAEFTIEGKSVSIFRANEDPLAWLTLHFGPPGRLAAQVTDEWLMHRGLPSRNAVSRGSAPLLRPRWMVPFANNPDDEEMINELAMSYREDHSSPIPSIVPLVVQDTVLLRSTEHLLAVDFETGKRIWEYPWAEPAASMLDENSQPARDRQQRRYQLEERLWFDAAYGQLASDGECVFLVDELQYVGAGTLPTTAQLVRRMAINDPTQPKDNNYLLALEIETQGKYRWRVGGPQGEDEPKMAGVFFLGSPLVVDDELFVMGERLGDISLYVLDADTGRLRWSQQLAHVAPVVRDPMRRLAGATPSYADGVLICPTSAGAVVAVDVPTRSLRWGYQYQREPVNRSHGAFQFNLNRAYGMPQGTSRDRWIDALAVVGEGAVVVTPPESDELICLDLLTGKVRWTHARDNEALFVAAIANGQALLARKSSLQALNLQDGQMTWEAEYSVEGSSKRGELPSGRGFLSGNHYFLPTTERLLQIDIVNGTVAAAQEIGYELGNIICYQDQILSLGPHGLHAFYQVERLADQVAERLKVNPADAWALEHQGLLALEAGDLPRAMKSLRDAVDAYPEDDDRRVAARTLMVETLLAMLEADIPFGTEQIAEVERLIDRPGQRERFLQLLGQRWLDENRPDRAFDAFLELAELQQMSSHLATLQAEQSVLNNQPGQMHVVRRDRFVRAGVREAWRQADAGQRQQMDQVIGRALEEALASDRATELSEFLRRFGDHPLATRATLDLARRYLDMEKLLEAEQLVAPLLERSSEAESGAALALLARVYLAANRPELLRECVERLRQEFGASVVGDEKTGAQVAAEFDETLGQVANPWPYGQVRVEDVQVRPGNISRQFQSYTNFRSITLREHRGPLAVGLRVAYDLTGNNSIIITDAYGRERARLPGTTGRTRRFPNDTLTSKTLGHLVIVNYGHGLMAADGLREDRTQSQVLWPDNYQESLGSAMVQRSEMNATREINEWGDESFAIRGRRVERIGPATYDGLVYLQGASLHCVEPLTGTPLWVRHDVSADSIVWGDDEFVLVAAPGEDTARVLRLLDGTLVGERPLPPAGRRWDYVGRNVLTWEEQSDVQGTQWRLRLYDPWTREDVWSTVFAAQSRGDLTPDGTLAIVEPGGRFQALDIRSGTPFIQATLPAESRKLLSIHVLESTDQLMLVRNFEPHENPGRTITSWPDPQTAPLINGDVQAFDRRRGSAQWQSPAVIENYGMPLDQAHGLPVLVFLRQEMDERSRSGRRGQLTLLCIDRRDGRLLLERDKIPRTYGSFFIAGDPETHTVSLRLLNSHGFQLTFTDEPQPPAPPAQTGRLAGNKQGGLSVVIDAMSNVVGGLFRLPSADSEPADVDDDELDEDEFEDKIEDERDGEEGGEETETEPAEKVKQAEKQADDDGPHGKRDGPDDLNREEAPREGPEPDGTATENSGAPAPGDNTDQQAPAPAPERNSP